MSDNPEYPGHLVERTKGSPPRQVSRFHCEVMVNGAPCGTEVGDKQGDILSHRKVHQHNSAYSRDAEKFPVAMVCHEQTKNKAGEIVPCGAEFSNKNNMVSHYRRHHDHVGDKNIVFRKYNV